MSVITAGEQRRRAGATRRRPIVAAVPGQQTMTAGAQRPGPATARGRRGPAGEQGRILTLVPPQRAAEAAGTAGAARSARAARPGEAARLGEAARPGAARAHAAQSQRAPAPMMEPQPVIPGLPAARLVRPQTARPGVAPHGTARARPAQTRVRLTRRGRIVVSVLIAAGMVLVGALAWLAGTASADAARSGPSPAAVYHSLRSVLVRPGESLWAIALQADPAGDPRSVIQEIIDLNALHGTSVQPGQRLWLPRG